jgi:hypothetical protein
VLHVLEHLEEERAFFPRCLGVCAGILFACGCRVECRAQQGILSLECGNHLLQECCVMVFRLCRILPHAAGARCRILERSMERAAAIVLPRAMQRIACSHEFGCIDTVIRIETEAAYIDGALERAAGNAAGACGVRDSELGHGRTSRAC